MHHSWNRAPLPRKVDVCTLSQPYLCKIALRYSRDEHNGSGGGNSENAVTLAEEIALAGTARDYDSRSRCPELRRDEILFREYECPLGVTALSWS
jgi:hypothetical protein